VALPPDAWELPADSDRGQRRVAFPEARQDADQRVDPDELEISVRLGVLLAALEDAVRIPDHRDQLPPDVVQEKAWVPDEVLPEARTAADRRLALLQQERQAE
jgi:hypothetical protein